MPDKDPFVDGKSIAEKHMAGAFERDGRLPARLQGYDLQLAGELHALVDGDDRFEHMATLAARNSILVELAFSWLARDDVPVFWIEQENGTKVLRHQPILNRIFSWMNSLRLNLAELGLTPAQAAKLMPATDELDAARILDELQEDGDGQDS